MRNGTDPGGGVRSVARPWLDTGNRYEMTFRLADLPGIRDIARVYGASAGLGDAGLMDFVLALSECAANALCHGDDEASLRLWVAGDHLFCEMQGGRWVFRQRPLAIAPDDVESLRLWVLQRVCDDVTVSIGAEGTTVLFSMSVR
jgi:serine/threonine-protein kinase RsbW